MHRRVQSNQHNSRQPTEQEALFRPTAFYRTESQHTSSSIDAASGKPSATRAINTMRTIWRKRRLAGG